MTWQLYLGVMVTAVAYIVTPLGPASGYESKDLQQTDAPATDPTEATTAEDMTDTTRDSRCIACSPGCGHCHQYMNGRCRPIHGCQ
ncbi:uncharacterized protein LOC123520322 isoform X2 [Portunus trituberculatus]|nr:uncharacterized protein LOC123520322 isoform X2 [Portunus trituberculatus]